MSLLTLLKIVCIVIISTSYLYAKKSLCHAMIDGAVLEGQCKGTLKNGRFFNYYNNGILAWEVHFKDNVLHGPFKHYYHSGQLHFSGFYKNGHLNNKFTKYNTDNTTFIANFKNGVLHNWIYVFIADKKVEALKYYYGKLIRKDFLK